MHTAELFRLQVLFIWVWQGRQLGFMLKRACGQESSTFALQHDESFLQAAAQSLVSCIFHSHVQPCQGDGCGEPRLLVTWRFAKRLF